MDHQIGGEMGIVKYGLAAAVLAGATAAGATSLSFASSGTLQSGTSKAASCQTSPLNTSFTPDPTGVYLNEVTITGIDKACGLKYLTLSLFNATGNLVAPNAVATVPLTTTHADDYVDIGNTIGTNGDNRDFPGHFAGITSASVDHVAVTFSDNPPGYRHP